MAEPLNELERQVDRGNQFVHSAITQTAQHVDDANALANGLAALLVQNGLLDGQELLAMVETVRTETHKSGRNVDVGIKVRKDTPEDLVDPGLEVDCEARIPYCRGACCSFSFPLTVDEIERGGPLKWDLGRPYFNRQGSGGYCHKSHEETHFCTIYEERPSVCRKYSCVEDDRIWKDFDAMIPNTEFLDQHFARAARGPVEIFMDAHGRD
ncbi:YkgJ family cysteine cluster protein [Solirubrobacter sp. CPCC 204708]|uniref:YkgJ family cysteine cluster protein n=1 Tax=Solirubrobacter deserti TaxID=2282478 RepID=A0ABT4RGG9_9ACTN|nr:YkgJ family cysteine cluster protein [Solirubrobacter deserti]MBE2319624.1 YkgJ family cysteine cluster protein [Solirubrobacter deserti]MDA0137637.1 YkgJ family cysteine cluster protein [Solirubrobacter deserti]